MEKLIFLIEKVDLADGSDQRICILENIRQEINAKIGVRVTFYRKL